jgi:hypothetical protein
MVMGNLPPPRTLGSAMWGRGLWSESLLLYPLSYEGDVTPSSFPKYEISNKPRTVQVHPARELRMTLGSYLQENLLLLLHGFLRPHPNRNFSSQEAITPSNAVASSPSVTSLEV